MDSLVFIMFFLSLIGILIGLKGIITGKIKFLKVNTRKKASGVFIAFLILFFVSTILIPSTDEPFKTIENDSLTKQPFRTMFKPPMKNPISAIYRKLKLP